MKIKKSIFGCGMALALTAGVANAQDPAEGEKKPLPAWLDNVYLGASIGATTTFTDVKQHNLWPATSYKNEIGFGGEGFVGYNFSSVISSEVHLSGYILRGSSRTKDLWFTSKVFSPTAVLRINYTNLIFSGAKKDRKWAVSSYGGLGLSAFKTALYQLQSADDTDPVVGYEGYTSASLDDADRTSELSVPVGVTISYKLNNKIDLIADGRATFVLTDKLDAYPHKGAREFYTYNAIGATYKFSDKGWEKPEDMIIDKIAEIDSIIDGFKDSDGDGVFDSHDKDNKTPEGAKTTSDGMAMDTDGDGVADYIDQERLSVCTEVDENGVALDSDGDNVPNCKDAEPNTPEGAQVDVNGKQINTLGAVAPVDTASKGGEAPAGADVGLPSVYFTLNSTSINYTNYPALTEVAKFMKKNGGSKLAIVGHTDSTGPADYNKQLGEKRAKAVIDHLVKIYGIDASRLQATSKGNSEPLAKGKANVNRRVDFLLTK